MARTKGSKNKPKVAVTNNNDAKQALLSTPWTSPTQFLPRFYVINPEAEKLIQPWERRQQIQLGRELFAKMPIVSSAIMNKNHVAVGNAWQPVFAGDIRNDADKQWIQTAESWLINDFYPNVNWQGQNFSFQDTLLLTGKDIDVEGGSLMLFRNTKNGLPRIQLVPVDKIGSRDGEDTIKGGSYDGYKIYDGIIYNGDNMPVALKLLGLKPEDDQIISLFNCQYIFEPAWQSTGHGISRVSYALTHLMDVQDINELLKITVKNFSAKGIIHKNRKGTAPKGKRVFGVETLPQANQNNVANEAQNKIFFESINKGGTEYISSLDGSDIQPFNFDRPSPNTEAFIFRISSEAIASMGWFVELVTPSKLNGTSVRLIQDQARKLIVWRQQTLERRAKSIVQYGLATAMQLGLIPKTDNKTWMRWTFNRPSELTVDNGYDNQAQLESLKMGIATKSEICAKRGKDWKLVSEQTDKELRDLFDRAKQLAKDYNISEAEAREWLSKRDIDIIAPQLPKEETNNTSTDASTEETN
jgi:hypothetical protein